MTFNETFYAFCSTLKDFLIFFCGFIISLSALSGFLLWLARFSEEAESEKYFDKVKANVLSYGLIPDVSFNPPEKVIVLFGGDRYLLVRKKVRMWLKAIPLKLKGKTIACPKIVIISPKKEASEIERKIKMIEEAFTPIRGEIFFDSSFLESLRCYYVYKYALKLEGAEAEITQICLKNFKGTEYADEIEKLDDPNWIPEVVLTPKSMLSKSVLECILEIIGLEIMESVSIEPPEIDDRREKTMDMICGLCENRYKTVFVGAAYHLVHLLSLVRKELKRGIQGILIGAYGGYIDKMGYMLPIISEDIRGKWGEDVDITTIIGKWRPRGREAIDAKWIVIKRKVVKVPEEIGESITSQRRKRGSKK